MSNHYVLGHTEQEVSRLKRQAEVFAEATEDILRRAGLAPGMQVIDIGCGAGDVSLAAARIVGPAGRVLGIDQADAPLRTARTRASTAAIDWLTFEQADLYVLDPSRSWDAIVGRFVLMHLPDPATAIAALARRLKPGGAIAFIEMDISAAVVLPDEPLFSTCLRWITELYRRAGAEPDMGSKLYGAFRAAGLTPAMAGSFRVEAGPDAFAYDYIAETLRSLAPSIEQWGIATAAEIAIDTLADRLRHAAIAGDHCYLFPRLIGAWAHTAG